MTRLISFSANISGYAQPEEPHKKTDTSTEEKPGQVIDDVGGLTTSPNAGYDELETFNQEWEQDSGSKEECSQARTWSEREQETQRNKQPYIETALCKGKEIGRSRKNDPQIAKGGRVPIARG
jgi:hypothetical protein